MRVLVIAVDGYALCMYAPQVLKAHPFRGINRKVQLKPIAWRVDTLADGTETEVPTEALFILKWGGELTALGQAQAEFLCVKFRWRVFRVRDLMGVCVRRDRCGYVTREDVPVRHRMSRCAGRGAGRVARRRFQVGRSCTSI